jgi:hypothetical protein
MPQLQRKCTVNMRIDDAEKCWNDFAKQRQSQGQQTPAGGGNGKTGTQDPGTVYFNDAGDGKVEVTMQLNPEGIADGDETTLNQRVDTYLQGFKQFAEAR